MGINPDSTSLSQCRHRHHRQDNHLPVFGIIIFRQMGTTPPVVQMSDPVGVDRLFQKGVTSWSGYLCWW